MLNNYLYILNTITIKPKKSPRNQYHVKNNKVISMKSTLQYGKMPLIFLLSFFILFSIHYPSWAEYNNNLTADGTTSTLLEKVRKDDLIVPIYIVNPGLDLLFKSLNVGNDPGAMMFNAGIAWSGIPYANEITNLERSHYCEPPRISTR